MKYTFPLLAVVLCCALFAQTSPPTGMRDKTPQHKAFINARIVVDPERSIENGTLIIKDGLIEAAGENLTVPDGIVTYDLQGKTIYPGFIDPLTEYGLNSVGDLNPKKEEEKPVYESRRKGATAWNDALHPQIDWVNYFEPNCDSSQKLIKLGFTTVQGGKMDGVLRGRAFVTLLGEGKPNDLILRPRASHYASFDKGSSQQEYPSSQMGSIALIRQMFLDADWYRVAQAAYKRNPEQPRPEFNASIEALADAENECFIFETEDEQAFLRADRLAGEFSLEMVLVGSNREYARIEQVKETGRTIILPVNFPEPPTVRTVEDELDITLAALRHWERVPANAAALEAHGVTFAFTTAHLKKRSDFLKNVRLAIDHGLSRSTALAALTTVPAEICGLTDRIGTLKQGKLANFFICDGDILLEDVTVLSTWIAGKRTKFVALDQTDFRGEYEFELYEHRLSLSLTGKIDELCGKLKRDDLKVTLKDIAVDGDKLNFLARMDSLNIEGLFRFIAHRAGDSLYGTCSGPDREHVAWSASLVGVDETGADSAMTGDSKGAAQFVSRLTYPNIAYGFDQLPQQEDVLIKNATVWTCEGDSLPRVIDVLVRNGTFTRIGPGLVAPSGVRVIDATGKHLTPGLIDEHSHLAISGNVNEGSHAVSAEVRIGDVINSRDPDVYRALAGGTTIIQTLHGSANPIGGQCQVLKLRWGSSPEDMKYVKAPPTIKFALGENVKQSNWGEDYIVRYPQSRMGVETIIKDAFQAALEYEKAWDEYNAQNGSGKQSTVPPRRNLLLEALLDVVQSRMFVTCHSYVQTEVLMLMRLAEEFGFRIQTFTHILEGYKVADEMAAHGSGGSCFSDWWAYKFEVYDAIPYNTCIMHERGINTCLNSDSPELGRRLNQEAAKSVMYCGISQEEALKMVTINPAVQLKIDDYVGSISVGKEADFVIWDGPPLSVYSHPEQTWIDGKKYFDIEQDHRMRLWDQDERSRLVQKVLAYKPPESGCEDRHGLKKKPDRASGKRTNPDTCLAAGQ